MPVESRERAPHPHGSWLRSREPRHDSGWCVQAQHPSWRPAETARKSLMIMQRPRHRRVNFTRDERRTLARVGDLAYDPRREPKSRESWTAGSTRQVLALGRSWESVRDLSLTGHVRAVSIHVTRGSPRPIERVLASREPRSVAWHGSLSDSLAKDDMP